MMTPDDADSGAAAGQPSAPRAVSPAAPVRVLLVDDHEDTNRSLVLLLGRRGYKVRSATSLQDAQTLARDEAFDVLVCDMSLPDGNGLELLARLRDSPPTYGGIVLSGYNDDEDLERSQAAGYKAHLAKPVDVSKLDATIRQIVADSGGAA